MEEFLQVVDLTKDYNKDGITLHVLENINFIVKHKKFNCILAPYSSGKSTLLKILAGLEKPTSGKIESKSGKIGYIPSKPSSFPWLNVKENIEYALKLSNRDAASTQKFIDLVGLRGYEDHYPENGSVGFRFRISLARALAIEPDLLLIDEPFNFPDEETKKEIYKLLRIIHQNLNLTIILSTSNISEALFLSDCIIMLKSNPPQIIKTIENPLPLERNQNIFISKEFNNLRKEIEDYFKVEETLLLPSLLV